MSESSPQSGPSAGIVLRLVGAWALVGIPLAWGVYNTLAQALKLFG